MMPTKYFKTIITSFVFTACYLTGYSQTIAFEQVLPPSPSPQVIPNFLGLHKGSNAFADIDGDGDEDVLITGQNIFLDRITKLYSNDGNGNYSEITTTPFEGVMNSSVAFADIDGDGDQDVLITGYNSSDQRISKLYSNDGNGNFQYIGAPFVAVMNGSVAFTDVDGDGDQDVLITGNDTSGPNYRIAKLYSNDGNGNFTEVTGTPFEEVSSGSVVFADIDGDGDQDVMIAGNTSSSPSNITKLYINDGIGNFTEVTGTPFEGIQYGSIALTDIDSDGDNDVLITGTNSSNTQITKLYTNDGVGSFIEATGTTFDGVEHGSGAYSDVDGDGDQDVLITGYSFLGQRISKLYKNDGSGNFTEETGTPFFGVQYSSVSFLDIDGDGDEDLLISGSRSSTRIISRLYVNDGSGNFTEATGTPFDRVLWGSVAFADVDADGDQDVLITGFNRSAGQLVSKLYSNEGSGNYTEVVGTPFYPVYHSSVAFSDIDGDGDEDIMITGSTSSSPSIITKLYTNDGIGNFTEVIGAPFENVRHGSIAFSDIDGDGDEDVLITGRDEFSNRIAKLYTNDGNGNFSELMGSTINGVNSSSIAFSDIDNDGDQDLLVTGEIVDNVYSSKLYNNDGNGNFTEVIGTPFDNVKDGSVAFADVDSDGDEDLLITGYYALADFISKLYTNDGSGNFTEVIGTPFESVDRSSIAFVDVEGDGDEDVLITGRGMSGNSGENISRLYINDGIGNFTEVTGLPFDGVRYSSAAIADVDGDGSQDVLIVGEDNGNLEVSNLYRNLSCLPLTTTTDSVSSCSNYTWPVNGVNYNQPGTYQESFTNQNGCVSIHILELELDCNLYANVSVTNNNGSICVGSAEGNAFNGASPYTFEYSDGQTTQLAENLCEGVYDLTTTDSDQNIYQTTFVVSDLTLDYNNDPDYQDYQDSLFTSAASNCIIDYSQPIDSFYVDQNSITLIDSNLYQVTWYVYQNSIEYTFIRVYYTTEDINGPFAYTLSLYCQGPTRSTLESINLTYKSYGLLSIEKHNVSSVLIYPNPTEKLVNIKVPSSQIGNNIILTNSLGQEVFSLKIEKSITQIDLNALSRGVYYINLKGLDQEGIVKKLIKN